MKYKIFHTGALENNCVVIYDDKTKQAAVIDPGGEADIIKDFINKNNLKLEKIINTHNHGDHIGANAELKKTYGADIYIHKLDAEGLENDSLNLSWMIESIVSPPADVLVNGGDRIKVGDIVLKVIHTPGHTPGSITLDVENENLIIAGDFLFYGDTGRTDLPGGSPAAMRESLKKFFLLFGDTEKKVITGHGPLTTIQEEKRNNKIS